MASIAQKLITAEEFFQMPEPIPPCNQELVHGVVVSTPLAGFAHGYCQGRTATLLDKHAHEHRLGQTAIGCGVIIERNPDTVRAPDVSYWSRERLPNIPVGYVETPPDLAVEVIAPEDLLSSLLAKVQEYLNCGIRMVWLVVPADHSVYVFGSEKQGPILQKADTLTGEDVLPGFSCPVAEFFA